MFTISEDLYKYTQFRGRPKNSKYHRLYGKTASVNQDKNARFAEAWLQKNDMDPVGPDEVIGLTSEFFTKIIKRAEIKVFKYEISANAIKGNKRVVDIPYQDIKDKYKLNNINHLLWMKFTTNGYLGCVAASNDINFDTNNPAGKIIQHVDEQWDETFVLIIPLSHISDGIRKDLECGLGNFLSEKGVPILDLYSHRFQ